MAAYLRLALLLVATFHVSVVQCDVNTVIDARLGISSPVRAQGPSRSKAVEPVLQGLNDVILSRLKLQEAKPEQLQLRRPNSLVARHLAETVSAISHMLSKAADANSERPTVVQDIIQAASSLVKNVNLTSGEVTKSIEALSALLDTLPPGSNLTLVRRVILGSLALRRMSVGPFENGAQVQRVEQLFVKLFKMAKEVAKQKRVVEFMHVSKSGGTSVCNIARLNGCSTQNWQDNCLVKDFDDRPRYFDANVHTTLRGSTHTRCDTMHKTMRSRGRELSCEERRQYMLSKGYTIYMNEYTALGGQANATLAHSCPNMLTALQLRHPHTRVISHIRHLYAEYQRLCRRDTDLFFARGHDTHNWAALAPAPLNNYLIRSLLGERAFKLPVWAINSAHLDRAKTFLAEQYDVIVVLEDSDLSSRAMRYGLGWRRDRELHLNPARAHTVHGLPRNMELLWRLNSLDVELYKYGRVMARLDGIMYDAVHAMLGDGRGRRASSNGGRGRRLLGRRQRSLLEDEQAEVEVAAAVAAAAGAPGNATVSAVAPAGAAVAPAGAGRRSGGLGPMGSRGSGGAGAGGALRPGSQGAGEGAGEGASREMKGVRPFVRGTSFSKRGRCGWVTEA